jgi:hypothetical protein
VPERTREIESVLDGGYRGRPKRERESRRAFRRAHPEVYTIRVSMMDRPARKTVVREADDNPWTDAALEQKAENAVGTGDAGPEADSEGAHIGPPEHRAPQCEPVGADASDVHRAAQVARSWLADAHNTVTGAQE